MRNLNFNNYGVLEMNTVEMMTTDGGFVESGYSSNSYGEYFWWIENGITYARYTTMFA